MPQPQADVPANNQAAPNWWRRHVLERDWFWPLAVWTGFGSFVRLFNHPAWNVASSVVTILAIFGIALGVHVSRFVAVLALVLLLAYVTLRGARLKWKRDRGTLPGALASPQTIIQHQNKNETYNYYFGSPSDPNVKASDADPPQTK